MVTVPVDTKELCTVHTTVNCTAGHLRARSAACVYVKVSKCIKNNNNNELKSRQIASSDTKKNNDQIYCTGWFWLVQKICHSCR